MAIHDDGRTRVLHATTSRILGLTYFMEDALQYVHVYTAGSCRANGTNYAIGGMGLYFGEGHKL